MDSKNGKASQLYRLLFNLTDKINLSINDKYIPLSNPNISYTWKNKENSYKKQFIILAPTRNKKIELPDGSYSVPDIQDYFENIIKNHETLTDNSPTRIYVNKIKNRIKFKIKIYYLQLLNTETITLLGSNKKN